LKGDASTERGVTRSDGVIFMGERPAKQRHDTVAHHLVDRALIMMDRLHHTLDHGVEKLAGLLGISVGEQLHRALKVGEEIGDLLALASPREGGSRHNRPIPITSGATTTIPTQADRNHARETSQYGPAE
jgi:hypothetical protein